MTIGRIGTYIVFICITAAVTAADQITKHAVTERVPLGTHVEIVPGHMNIVHVRNPGAAFGMFSRSTSQFRPVLFLVVSLGAILVIIWTLVTSETIGWALLTACALFMAGVTGNLIDRIRFGEVIDFLDVYVGSFHWPAFNVADAALCTAVGLIFVHFLGTRSAADHESSSQQP
jgi:signal peptidase II